MSDEQFVVVRRFSDRVEAELARGALEAAGIDVVLRSDDCEGLNPGLTFSNDAQLVVRAADAEAAREILDTPAKPA